MKEKKFTQNHEAWLIISEAELKLAKKAVKGDDVIVIPAVFLTQQAAEKALKAYLTSSSVSFTKTHNLIDLLELCIEVDTEFNQLVNKAFDLNPYAIRCRYPEDCFIVPSLDAVHKCIKDAEDILTFVKSKI